MPPIIKHTDIIDFPAYQAAIKEAKAALRDFGKVFEGVLARINQRQGVLLDNLKRYKQIIADFNTALAGAGSGLSQLNSDVANSIAMLNDFKQAAQGVNDVLKAQKSSLAAVQKEYAAMKQQINALKADQNRYEKQLNDLNRKLADNTARMQQSAAAIRKTSDAAKLANGSFAKLEAELNKMKNDLKNMPNAFDQVTGKLNKNNKEAVALRTNIAKLEGTYKSAEKSMNLFSKSSGNLSNVLGSLGSQLSPSGAGSLLSGLGGIAAGLGAILGVSHVLAQQSAKFEALNTAIKSVSASTEDYANNQAFLQRLTNDYGQDIFTLAGSYKNLTAATKGTRLEGAGTKDIFEGIIQAGTALRLTNEQVEGSLLALQQMISKGNIQAEELRGQLSERLPGAFRIFADSMGVSEVELNKLLKEGKVMAQDVIPKFAAELKRLYSAEAISNANALVNEQNRLNNAWEIFLATFSDTTGITNFWKAFKSGLAESLSDLTAWLKSPDWGDFLRLLKPVGQRGVSNTHIRRIVEETNAQDIEKRTTEFQKMSDQARAFELKKQRGFYDIMLKEQKRFDNETIQARIAQQAKLLDSLNAAQAEIAKVEAKNKQKPAGVDYEALRKVVDKQLALLKKGYEIDLAQNELNLAKKEIDQWQFEKKKYELGINYVAMATETELRMQKEADQEKLGDFKKLRLDIEKEHVESEQRMLDKLNSKRRAGPDVDTKDPSVQLEVRESPFAKDVENIKKRNDAAVAARLKGELDAENKAFEILSAGRDTNYQEELRHLEKLKAIKTKYAQSTAEEEYAIAELNAEREHQLREQTAEFIVNTMSTALDAVQNIQNQKFEDRINQLEEEKNRAIDAAGDNAEARKKIEEQYNKKIAKEKQKQAKSDKNFALFNVALSTAQSIAKTFAIWGWPAGIPFAALALASGIVQAAAIASKPIPQYKKGTQSAKPGLSTVAEDGRELVKKKSGQYVLYEKPAFVDMEGGEQVFTNDATERLIREAEDQRERERDLQASLLADYESLKFKENTKSDNIDLVLKALRQSGLSEAAIERAMTRAMEGMPVPVLRIDERGYQEGVKKRNQMTMYLNSRYH